MNRSTTVQENIKRLPVRPGVYLMKDEAGDIIYIGKAKNLRSRVRSYFTRADDSRYLVKFLMSRVGDVDHIITDTEKEALILESNLIKKHKPFYNVNLKDDKRYFSLKVQIKDSFPRLEMVRKVQKDGAKYFGPYSSGNALRDTVKMISRTFLIRTCTDSNFKNRIRPCLLYQIKRCSAPCCGLIDEENYRECVKEVILFLEGGNQKLLKILRKRMQDESDRMNFEEAATIRDRISSIVKTIEKQKVASFSTVDRDVFAYHRESGIMEILIMIVRGGIALDTHAFSLTDLEIPSEDVLCSFLKQYYLENRFIPQEILLPLTIEDRELMEEWFSEKRGRRVRIHHPKKGEKYNLIRMVAENARDSFRNRQAVRSADQSRLEDIRKELHLQKLPVKIECFDISNISGKLAVGSMVAFTDGRPDKRHYRHFKIKAVDQPDDCKMMYEVVKRRFSGSSEGSDLPDLVIMDGGKGQLNVALRVFRELNIVEIDAIGLAKSEQGDMIFIPRRKNPILLKRNSNTLLRLQQIRDEAHRFAVSYHKKIRKKQNLRSILDDIPGVGSVRKRALLKHFGSLQGVKKAGFEELTEVKGMNRQVAGNVFEFFRNLPSESHLSSEVPDIVEPNPWSPREEQY